MKKYTARPHAVDRAVLRFGISSEHAENWFNQLMCNARLLGEIGGQAYYDHKGKRIVTQGNEIVTIMKAEDLPFGNKISELVRKELAKAKRNLTKREREFAIRIAEADLERATIALNYAKAKSPVVRNSLSEKLSEVQYVLAKLRRELEKERDDYNAMKINSMGYIITETCDRVGAII